MTVIQNQTAFWLLLVRRQNSDENVEVDASADKINWEIKNLSTDKKVPNG